VVQHLPVDDPQWYRHAVFYEIYVRGFLDSSGDGTGDFLGVVEKLDYLHWLGVDCLWLLPFYASPLRDGGYDISDFMDVHPTYGTRDDLLTLIYEAHRRGMRVIGDLVLNHTSDQHPWFVESRGDRTNPRADWYVWHDDDQRWADVPIIFKDTEPSNWTWCPDRGQYYWHRFFHHQPDLNYRNPEVQDAMLEVVRTWLAFGLDGFRLDAVPYLFEADGTLGQNLPETHAFLRRLRAEVDRVAPGTVLLAEANQWPTDLVDYFGDGDECHMCFHFPLMPRMYLAAKRGEASPITSLLAETPPLPPGCQWATFLRNHDELTLEMVTDAERDELFEEYAADPMMRRNNGIGRRLSPLLRDDRRLVELFYLLLLSLPGSPVLYYGDEIGMGDDTRLGDRDSVRTPMQWTAEPSAGFSPLPPHELYLPLVSDPRFTNNHVNVAAQQHDEHSLLRWLRHAMSLRRNRPQLAVGDYVPVESENPAVLAFVRTGEADQCHDVLCVANLSNRNVASRLSLERWAGWTVTEIFGGEGFPTVVNGHYLVQLAPRHMLLLDLTTEPGGPPCTADSETSPRRHWWSRSTGSKQTSPPWRRRSPEGSSGPT
jgi:maltose alpha-D-glucosyltransferase/alpha-amylase